MNQPNGTIRARQKAIQSISFAGFLNLLILAGCNSSSLNDDYGKRRGAGLNGLSVLSEMYRQQGSRVVAWKRLSPKTQKQDTIIWAPTDYAGLTTDQIEFFEDWFVNGTDRTLIIINHDYDAAIGHWQSLLDRATGQQAIEIRRRLAFAESKYRRQAQDDDLPDCRWFDMKPRDRSGWADDLGGKWSDSINPNNARIYLGAALTFPKKGYDVEHLLLDDDHPVVSRLTHPNWHDGNKVIVLANGSMLFNQPLVNHENRKIAALVLEESDNPRRVMIIEGASDAVPIRDTDASAPLMLQAFTIWPINFLLIHATLLGILFCISVYPIFGRPREIANENISDFGKHVAAYGDMLQRTGSASYVQDRIRHFREITHSHDSP